MTESTSRARIAGLLDQLHDTVEHARGVPMSASVMVGRSEVLGLVDEIRSSLPVQLFEADKLLAEADAIRGRAQERGEQLIADARERAERLVQADAITRAAEVRASEIVAAAQAQAAKLLREADQHCDAQLAAFEVDITKVLDQTHAARDYLAARIERAGGPAAHDADGAAQEDE